MKVNELIISEQEIVAEGILSSLKSGYDAVKAYSANIAAAASAHKELKSLDGKKVWSTNNLQQEAMRVRSELLTALNKASPKMQAIIRAGVKTMGAAPLDGAYIGRNYYRDFIVYSLIKPITDISLLDTGKFGLERVVDKLVGFLITAVTGIPAIADIKDAADVAKGMAKAANSLALKINDLRPSIVGEDLILL